jgi:OOP family OmpA-OmpF porin
MSTSGKIVIGAIATTAAAWFLYGPLGLGARCIAEADARLAAAESGATAAGAATAAAGGLAAGAVVETPASAEAVAECQGNVTQIASSGAVNFATSGAAFAPESGALLDRLAEAARPCAGTTMEVAGHTDAQGDAKANEALSQRRAEAVVAALTERGVPAARLTARGYGETQLLDTAGPENNPVNRRIEFKVAAVGAPAN